MNVSDDWDDRKIPVDVDIVDTRTGERVVYQTELWCADEYDCGIFIWEEGNYACDCNRELFFRRAKGEKVDACTTACGEGRYRVRIRGKDGAVIYIEDYAWE